MRIFKKIGEQSKTLTFIGLLAIIASLTITPTIGDPKNFFVYHSIDFFVLAAGLVTFSYGLYKLIKDGKEKQKKTIEVKQRVSKSLLLKAFLLLFLPIISFIPFSYLTYPLKPHCSLGNGILGCTPMCEPISYFEDGRPAGYKVIPCYHEEPSEFQKNLFNNWFLMPLVLFIILTLWVYKEGGKKVIKILKYIALAPVYIFKENRQNKNFFSRLVVILISFFLFAEWALGYYVAGTTLLGKEPFNFPLPPPQSNQMISNLPSFTGQDVFNAVNKYRKENNVSELKLDEVLCNNLAQRYLDIKSGEKENIAHKGFDEWYEKYVKPYGYTISENYACGQTPEDIIKAWDGSPGHKLSILDKKNKLACTYAAEGCAVIVLGYKTAPQVKGAQTNIGNDPIVNCQISPECGGGSRQMKKSECEQSVCCQIGSKWYFYLSREKCSEDQKNYRQDTYKPLTINNSSTGTSDRIPVFLSFYGYTLYCPPQNIDAIKSINQTMEAKKSEWDKNYKDCVDLERTTDPCQKNCDSQMRTENENCVRLYGDNVNSPEYSTCTNRVTEEYLNCSDKCPNPYTTCRRVYEEQNYLYNQIKNLCN